MKDYFTEVIGYEEIKKELYRILDIMENKQKYLELGANIPRGIILDGDPGVGKTLLANCFINASKRKAYTLRKKDSKDDFIKLISNTFKEAMENQPSIILLDDLDKFSDSPFCNDNIVEYISIQSNIDECKKHDVFVIATTNNMSCLPESLLRPGRFDKIFKVTNPTGEDAIKIVKHYLEQKKVASDVDYNEISRLLDGGSCADLENIINEAAIIAGYKEKDSIEHEDLVEAFMRVVYDGPEKICEKNNITNSSFQRHTAIHEAGHAVVGEVLQPESINLITVKKHTGNIEGFVAYQKIDEYFESKQFMENRVVSLLAGKAATEVIFGTTDVGSNYDLHRAFDIVTRFVDDYCSYGFTNWEGITRNSSANVLSNKTILVQSEMDRYYRIAKKIIIDNKDFLLAIADKVQEKKYLTFNEIQEIKSAFTTKSPGIFCV